jgi:hypothetical protein
MIWTVEIKGHQNGPNTEKKNDVLISLHQLTALHMANLTHTLDQNDFRTLTINQIVNQPSLGAHVLHNTKKHTKRLLKMNTRIYKHGFPKKKYSLEMQRL